MSHDAINHWVEQAKQAEGSAAPTENNGVQVIKRKILPQNKGKLIMEIADKLFPRLKKMLEGVRDNDGMLVQTPTVRGIALNVAQSIVREHEKLEQASA